jgi:hypothetical protein
MGQTEYDLGVLKFKKTLEKGGEINYLNPFQKIFAGLIFWWDVNNISM